MVIEKTKLSGKKRTRLVLSDESKSKIVREYKKGGITIKQLHEKYGSCTRSISRWIVEAGANRLPKRKPRSVKAGFVEIKVPSVEKQVIEKRLSIIFKTGMELQFNDRIPAAYVATLVKEFGY